jgi:thymidylate kinase
MTAEYGRLVILTGVNGAGKGTIGPLAAEKLSQETGKTWAYIHGPKANGYTNRVREITLDPDPKRRPKGLIADALLWFSQHAESAMVVDEKRQEGISVILDRGPETTLVYNVWGPRLQRQFGWLEKIYEELLIQQFRPDLGIVLDIEVEEILARSKGQSATDHYQEQEIGKHRDRRELFLCLGRQDGWIIVDAMPSIEEVLEKVVDEIYHELV